MTTIYIGDRVAYWEELDVEYYQKLVGTVVGFRRYYPNPNRVLLLVRWDNGREWLVTSGVLRKV